MDGAQSPGPGVQRLNAYPYGREEAASWQHSVRWPLPTWASSALTAAATLQVTDMSCHRSPAQASWQIELSHCRLNKWFRSHFWLQDEGRDIQVLWPDGILWGLREKLFRILIHASFSSFQKAWVARRHFLIYSIHFPVWIKQLTGAFRSFADNYLVSVILAIKK